MTYGEAWCQLEKGKGIRQANWAKNKRIQLCENRYHDMVPMVKWNGWNRPEAYRPTHGEYAATNWEIWLNETL